MSNVDELVGLRVLLAATILAAEECYDEADETPADHIKYMVNFVQKSKGDGHFGDCTKDAQTCSRCVAEEYLAKADALLKQLED